MSTFSDIGVKVLLVSFVLSILPNSPFTSFNNLVNQLPYLSFVNWFLPIPEMLVIIESWLVIVSAYYGMLYVINYVGLVKS